VKGVKGIFFHDHTVLLPNRLWRIIAA